MEANADAFKIYSKTGGENDEENHGQPSFSQVLKYANLLVMVVKFEGLATWSRERHQQTIKNDTNIHPEVPCLILFLQKSQKFIKHGTGKTTQIHHKTIKKQFPAK